jgi:hypothetical protein
LKFNPGIQPTCPDLDLLIPDGPFENLIFLIEPVTRDRQGKIYVVLVLLVLRIGLHQHPSCLCAIWHFNAGMLAGVQRCRHQTIIPDSKQLSDFADMQLSTRNFLTHFDI